MLSWAKTHRWLTVVLVSGALLVILFAGSLFVQFVHEVCQQNEYTHAKECANHHLGPYIILWAVTVVDAHNGFFSALAGIAIAIFTATLWYVTDKAVNLARAEFISTHRPRLIMRDVFIYEEGGVWKVFYTVVNTGETKATIVESRVFIEVPTKDGLVINPKSATYNDIGQLEFEAGQERDLELIPDSFQTFVAALHREATSIPGMASLDTRLHFAGNILYSDSLGNRRRTVFRRRYDGQRKRFYGIDDPEHEYAD